MDEIDESVAHVALVVGVDRQVEEVYPVLELPRQLVEQHLLSVLVWNVTDHQSCTTVTLDRVRVDREGGFGRSGEAASLSLQLVVEA
jgi:hypothetical protein